VHGLKVDEAAIKEYETLRRGAVPKCLIEHSVIGGTKEEAMNLAKTYFGERRGYANTADLPEIERFMEAAATGTAQTSSHGTT